MGECQIGESAGRFERIAETEPILKSSRRTLVSQVNRTPVVLVHRYFVPDSAPYANMLADIALMSSTWWPTTVVTGDVPYRATADSQVSQVGDQNLGVVRLHLSPERGRNRTVRLRNSLVFSLRSAVEVLRRIEPGGVVMAATTPPIVVSFSIALASKIVGASFVYHNQDIYPEVLGDGTLRSKGGYPLRLMRVVDTITGKLSRRIVVLSEDMKSVWVERGIDPEKISVIANFVAAGFHGVSAPLDQFRNGFATPENARLQVYFVGNVGPLQGLEQSLPAIADSGRVDVKVYGDGRCVAALAALELPNVSLQGSVGSTEVPALLAKADLGLVSLRSGAERAAYPSKIMTFLELGVPLLALVEPRSSLAREIVTNGVGFVPTETSTLAVVAEFDRFIGMDGTEKSAMQTRCRAYAARFSREEALRKWQALFKEVLT